MKKVATMPSRVGEEKLGDDGNYDVPPVAKRERKNKKTVFSLDKGALRQMRLEILKRFGTRRAIKPTKGMG